MPTMGSRKQSLTDTIISLALTSNLHSIRTQQPIVYRARCGAVLNWGLNRVNHESRCVEFQSCWASAKGRVLSATGACVPCDTCVLCVCVHVRVVGIWGPFTVRDQEELACPVAILSSLPVIYISPWVPRQHHSFLNHFMTLGSLGLVSRGLKSLVF